MALGLKTMQVVDYWVGVPLCCLFSVLHALWRHLFGRAKKVRPQKILFIELSEMGSAFLAYPSMKTLLREYPGSELFFLIFERNRESVLLTGLVPSEKILTIDDRSLIRFGFSTVRTIVQMWRLGIDTAIDAELFSRCTALLTFLSGAVNRVGFHKFTDEGLYRGSLLTHRVLYNNLLHMSLNFLALVLALREDEKSEPLTKLDPRPFQVSLPQLPVDVEDRLKILRKLSEVGYNPGVHNLVLFNPDPGLLTLRGWSRDSYRELAHLLLETFPDVVLGVIGLPRARSYAEFMQASLGRARVFDLAGKTDSMFELGVLFGEAKLLIGTDSGPAHLAALTPILSITLFGPETPVRYAPLGERSYTLSAGLACSPCYSAANHRRSSCTDNRCMSEISVRQVFELAAKLLRERNGVAA